jgi:hypothetical protein
LQALPISVTASAAAALLIRMFMTLSYGGKFDADPAVRELLAHNYVSAGEFCNSNNAELCSRLTDSPPFPTESSVDQAASALPR